MVLVEGSLMRGKPLCITHRLRVLCVILETPACLPLPAPLVDRASFGLVLPPLAFLPPRGARPAGGRGGIFVKREPLVVMVWEAKHDEAVKLRQLPVGATAGAIVAQNIGGIAAATMPPDQLLKP